MGLFGLGLGFIISILDPFLYTEKTRLIAPPAFRNTVLGFITIMSLLVALVAQPVVGRWSDRSRSRWGKRAPFLAGGVLGLSLALILLLLADQLWLLVSAAMLLSASTNTTQSAWQALIPDYVPKWQHGTAAGIKTILELIGTLAGITVIGMTLVRGNLWGAPLTAIVLFFAILIITVYSLRHKADETAQPVAGQTARPSNEGEARPAGQANEPPPPRPGIRTSPQQVYRVARSFVEHTPPAFFWWMLNRFLFWSAAISIRTFLLNYMEDVLSLSLAEAEALANRLFIILGIGIFLLVLPAGAITDRIGRRPLLIAAGLLAAAGVLFFILVQDLNMLFIAGGLIAAGAGLFAGTSWALATDLVPGGEGAQYLAIANIATVLGSIGGRLGGPLIDAVNYLTRTTGTGYVVVYIIATLFFAGSSLVVLKIKEKR